MTNLWTVYGNGEVDTDEVRYAERRKTVGKPRRSKNRNLNLGLECENKKKGPQYTEREPLFLENVWISQTQKWC